MTTPQLLSRTRQHPGKAHAQHLPSCHRERSRYVIVLLSLYFPPHQDERHCITNGVWSAWAGNVARHWVRVLGRSRPTYSCGANKWSDGLCLRNIQATHLRRWGIHSSGISPMDCKSSRHVSEQPAAPHARPIPRGEAPRVAPGRADYTARTEWSLTARTLPWQHSFSSLPGWRRRVGQRRHPARLPW